MTSKLLEYIGFDNLKDYSIEIFDFYLKPIRFFRKFSKKDLAEKILQTIYYCIILIALGYILIEEITIKELAKATIFEISALIGIIITLSTSELIVSKIKKKKPRIVDLIFFAIIAKLLIAPFQVVFYGMFLNYENYNYFFISNLIILFLTLYILFFSAIIFNKRKKYSLIQIILNLLIINILFFTINKISLDNFSTFEYGYSDRIMEERLKKGLYLKEIYTVPTHKTLVFGENINPEVFYLFSTPFDTISKGGIERQNKFKENIKYNLNVLDTLKLKSKRNQAFFKKIEKLNRSLDSTVNQDITTELENIKVDKIIEANNYVKQDSSSAYKEWIFKVPNKIEELNLEILEEQLDLENKAKNSVYPLIIMNYLYPLVNKSKKTHPNNGYK